MKHALSVSALVLAAIALFFAVRRPAPDTPPAEEPPTLHSGFIILEAQGQGAGSCRITQKFPERLRVKPADEIEWQVTNRCDTAATFEIHEVGPAPGAGNSSDQQSPFASSDLPDVPAGGTGLLQATIKTQDALAPADPHHRDRWRFRWRVNNAVQQDPEIEVEYRRR